MKKQTPPDWKCNRHIFGPGSIKSIPEPQTHYFPHPEGNRRRVEITITKHYGIGQHYYVAIREENNLLWGGDGWYRFDDDEAADGAELYSSGFATMAPAKAWIRKQLKQFPRSTHDATYKTRTPKGFYREGD